MKAIQLCAGVSLVACWLGARGALAADFDATPSDYKTLLGKLQPGDTLRLSAGNYPRLNIADLNGTESAWITITGPTSGAAAIIDADSGPCCNTVEITNSSFVALEHVTIDGKNVDGAFGISAKGGTNNLVHNIRIESCDLINHHGSQQHSAISTKTPTWGWVIRNNRISNAGTGIYLGNSDGTFPFIGGLIENNLVDKTIGYSMQIKWQKPRPTTIEGMPTGPSTTIVRNNVFMKSDDPSPDGDRPNVLVGGFPETGPGSEDRYEIYGNFFFHNPRESLLQASGRVSIHDNVFVDAPTTRAILLRDHDLPLRKAWVYNNTIYGTPAGVVFGNAAPQGDAVVGNLIFAATPIQGPIVDQKDNITDTVANASMYVKAPNTTLGSMDFYPLAGKCTGSPINEAGFASDADHDVDFNGTSKGDFTYRGAYAGEGDNPGWQLADAIKTATSTTIPGGGTGGSGGSASSGNGGGSTGGGHNNGNEGGGGASASHDTAEDSGCSCAVAGSSAGSSWWGLGIGLALAAMGRRRSVAGPHREK